MSVTESYTLYTVSSEFVQPSNPCSNPPLGTWYSPSIGSGAGSGSGVGSGSGIGASLPGSLTYPAGRNSSPKTGFVS